MKSPRLFGVGLSAALVAAAVGRPVAFTAGNLVVVQAGDGSGTLDSSALAIVVKEISPLDGSVVQSIALPVVLSGTNHAITLSGTAGSQGFIARSTDGQYFVLTGFDTPVGTANVSSSTPDFVPRVVARIDMNGNVDTSTALGDAYSGDLIRSVVSTNGTDFWTGGTGSVVASAGVRYTTLGATTSTQLASDATNIRGLTIDGGNLYMTSAFGANVGANQVGTGLPTTSGQTTTLLPGFPTGGPVSPSPYGIFFSDANTCYVADDNLTTNGGGIQKWTLSAGTWTLAYTLNSGSGARGLAGRVDAGVVTLYATVTAQGTSVMKITDTGAGSVGTPLLAPPNQTAFRGVAVVPGIPPASGACCLTGGACSVLTQSGCGAQGGAYQGNNITCLSANCGSRTGACCLSDNTCSIATSTQCAGNAGIYRGDGTSCGTTACTQSFAAGSLMVLQIGDGSVAVQGGAGATATNYAGPLFLKEIRISDGAVLQSIGMPTVASSVGNRALTHSTNSTTEGALNLSTNGQYLICVGYNANVGTLGGANPAASGTISRVVARVSAAGLVDTTTAFTDSSFGSSNIRAATSTDGNAIWATGTASASANGGCRYTTYGGSAGTLLNNPGGVQIPSTGNVRSVGIFNGQLYFSSGAGGALGINQVGTGLPTTAGQTVTLLAGSTNPEDFFFSDPNTVYVGRNLSTSPGVEKWVNNAGLWTLAYILNDNATVTSPMQHVTGKVKGGVVTLYGTLADTITAGAGNRLVRVTDNGSNETSPYTVIATSAGNTWYKGVAFAPVGGTTPCYANCDHSTILPCLNVQDFGCFLNKFAASDPYANCDGSTIAPVLNVQDFGCFLNKFAAGCSNC